MLGQQQPEDYPQWLSRDFADCHTRPGLQDRTQERP